MYKIFQPASGSAVGTSGRSSRIRALTIWLTSFLFAALLHEPIQAFSAAPTPEPYSLSLAWDPSPSPEVIGYVVYYGAASEDYTNSVLVGAETMVSISGLLSGITYYFAITAYDTDGQESGFSNEVSYRREPSGAQLQIVSADTEQFTLTVTGPTGHTYDIEATEDFSTWTVIGNVTLDATGSLDFTDTNTADFPQRFYRTRDTQP